MFDPDARLRAVTLLGQSLWLDYIRRDELRNGALARRIERGQVRGVTSNPTIFMKAITGSEVYRPAIESLARQGLSAEAIFEHLAVEDIQAACDLFRPLYDRTHGLDGFVSLEVSPYLARDTQATVRAALRLWERVARPNLMIKIPGTREGLPAIVEALAAGVNVNVTLLFSVERYRVVMEAYLTALERRLEAGQPLDAVVSVASFFVSRVDTLVDRRLEEIGTPEALALRGKIAVANAKMAYQAFKEVFSGERFARLAAHGARVQRPLWASTSTKNPAYSDIKYVEELIGPHTVNTVPPHTLAAFADHGEPRLTLEARLEEAAAALEALPNLGIDLAQVTDELERAGVDAFAQAYAALLQAIDQVRGGGNGG
ncbi:MAG TPA: transaldolase [Anaerolineae bacterium]|nr:transaldolase [Anaerolineae bacterium]